MTYSKSQADWRARYWPQLRNTRKWRQRLFIGTVENGGRIERAHGEQRRAVAGGMNLERRKRKRQLTLDYLSAAAGGPMLYLDQDMKTAHAGLEISTREWEVSMEHVQRALAKFRVPDAESSEFMALFSSVADQIIERKRSYLQHRALCF